MRWRSSPVGKTNNQGRVSVRRGRQSRRSDGGLNLYINNMFRGTADKEMAPYEANLSMRGEVTAMRDDFKAVADELLASGRDLAGDVAAEFEEFADEVVDATPWHEPGPSDPPFHAAEVWKTDFYPNNNGGYTLTLWNPKDYMAFLEAGWSSQAPAGWIAGLWAAFLQRLRNV